MFCTAFVMFRWNSVLTCCTASVCGSGLGLFCSSIKCSPWRSLRREVWREELAREDRAGGWRLGAILRAVRNLVGLGYGG